MNLTDNDSEPVTLINTFFAKPGQVDAFLELQIAETKRLGSQARELGWMGNRIYRCHDGETVVIVTTFKSLEAKKFWAKSPLFLDHLERIKPLLDHVHSRPSALVFEGGSFGVSA